MESLKSRGLAAAMLAECLTVLSLISIPSVCLNVFAVSCCLSCWTTGNGWATRDEGEECQCQKNTVIFGLHNTLDLVSCSRDS